MKTTNFTETLGNNRINRNLRLEVTNNFNVICIVLIFRVVVGAPLGNKTSPSRERDRYGSVYKCRHDSTNCEVIAIDDSGKRQCIFVDHCHNK